MQWLLLTVLISLAILSAGCVRSEPTVINAVNVSTNSRIKYTLESEDYWQTPEETINRGRGDCEDFAILKQAILAELGIESTVYIVWVPNGVPTPWHAVTITSAGWVLDNNYDYLRRKEDYRVIMTLYDLYTRRHNGLSN